MTKNERSCVCVCLFKLYILLSTELPCISVLKEYITLFVILTHFCWVIQQSRPLGQGLKESVPKMGFTLSTVVPQQGKVQLAEMCFKIDP